MNKIAGASIFEVPAAKIDVKMEQEKQVKKLMIWVIGIMIAEAFIFYRFGKLDTMIDLRQQYPQVINFRKVDARMEPKPGDLWITDSAYVHYYVPGSGWVKAMKPNFEK